MMKVWYCGVWEAFHQKVSHAVVVRRSFAALLFSFCFCRQSYDQFALELRRMRSESHWFLQPLFQSVVKPKQSKLRAVPLLTSSPKCWSRGKWKNSMISLKFFMALDPCPVKLKLIKAECPADLTCIIALESCILNISKTSLPCRLKILTLCQKLTNFPQKLSWKLTLALWLFRDLRSNDLASFSLMILFSAQFWHYLEAEVFILGGITSSFVPI